MTIITYITLFPFIPYAIHNLVSIEYITVIHPSITSNKTFGVPFNSLNATPFRSIVKKKKKYKIIYINKNCAK